MAKKRSQLLVFGLLSLGEEKIVIYDFSRTLKNRILCLKPPELLFIGSEKGKTKFLLWSRNYYITPFDCLLS